MNDLAQARATRIPARLRLTLACSALMATTGLVLTAAIYLFMRYVPTYAIAGTGAPAPTDPGQPMTDGAGIAQPQPVLVLTNSGDILNTLLVSAIIAVAALTLLGGWIGWLIAGGLLRPVRQVTAAARCAGSGDLTGRVGLRGRRDEFIELSETFDEMLDRLEISFLSHQRFAANASHELRTPLATTRAIIDAALGDPEADADSLRRLVERVRETNERSVATVEALLDLSMIGAVPIEVGPLRLDTIVATALAELEPEVRSRGLQLSARLEAAEAEGEATLVHQAVVNLILNSVHHNHDRGSIELRTRQLADSSAIVEIENTGDLLDATDVATFVEPFVRQAGRADRRGHGLGLTLVHTIAGAIHGELELEPRAGGGLKASITLRATAT